MTCGAGALLAAGLWPGALAAADADAGPGFRFFCINDLHYIDEKCGRFLEGVVAQLKRTPGGPVDFCVIAGDLTDLGEAAAFAAVRDVFKGLDMPVRVVIGNHDYLAGTDRKAYEEIHPGSINYTFEHKGWQFVALDSTDGTKAAVSVQPPTFAWLDAALPKLDAKRPTVLYTHFPLGATVPSRAKNADDVLDRFKGLNLRGVFGGHHHGLTERTRGDVPITTNRCCSLRRQNHDKSTAKGYFLCTVKDAAVTHEFVEVPMPGAATRPG